MAKEYIGSEEHFHDRVSAYYDEKERIEREQINQINKQIMSEFTTANDKTEAMREQKKWTVKSDINDTNAPNNVFEYFWLECEDGEELTISPDHDPRPNGTDRVKEYLEGLAERLNSADELRQLREENAALRNEPSAMTNELIAEFMGVELERGTSRNLSGPHKGKIGLWYHTSWDWLMLVVEKIESIELEKDRNPVVTIDKEVCIISDNGEAEIILCRRFGSRLQNCYEALVEFIKWYNENK